MPFISIHALRVEGDSKMYEKSKAPLYFYPRPPGGGRRPCFRVGHDELPISIHALRVEGDHNQCKLPGRRRNFYPRPPGGGRPKHVIFAFVSIKFLSTPSGWRATGYINSIRYNHGYFYPRPPGGGRRLSRRAGSPPPVFLSTPSGWRAT